jgi:hypothetical protein
VTRPPRPPRPPEDALPDVRDGLNRIERAILVALAELQAERPDGANVPLPMLYGRVVERVDVGVEEFQEIVARLVGRGPV